MKKIIALLAVVACLAAVSAPAAAKQAKAKARPSAQAREGSSETVNAPGKALTEPNAFNGVKWGTPPAAIPDLTVVEKAGDATYATVPNVAYRIGNAFLSNMVYAFCREKFAAVMLDYRGRKNHAAIRKLLMKKYAAPLEVGEDSNNLAWPVGNVIIRMEFDAAKDTGNLSYFYQPLYAPCTADDGKAAQP